MHHVGEDRQGNLGPDGEGNLAHPAGRVRPYRDRAGQHPGLGVGVELKAAEIVLPQVSPGGAAQPSPDRDQPSATGALTALSSIRAPFPAAPPPKPAESSDRTETPEPPETPESPKSPETPEPLE